MANEVENVFLEMQRKHVEVRLYNLRVKYGKNAFPEAQKAMEEALK